MPDKITTIQLGEGYVYCDSGNCEVYIFIPIYTNKRCPSCEMVGTDVGEE